MGDKKIRVLIVDDSMLVRSILSEGLAKDPRIEVAGVAVDAFDARDKIVALKPDVVTLDVEMPRMDGVEFLRRLMPQYPIPVVMVSSLTQRGKQITIESLEAGAIDFVSKPTSGGTDALNSMMDDLISKIKVASSASVSHWKSIDFTEPKGVVSPPKTVSNPNEKVIVIGASTGGSEAISRIIPRLPTETPGLLVVQHMPQGFTKMFAERLNGQCQMDVKEAESGDRVVAGRILIAPGSLHTRITKSGGGYQVVCEEGELVNGHCPSIDVAMLSVAKHANKNAIGVLLTGMGRDGADGMVTMRKAGSKNIAQDEATSTIFGMPKEAYISGGADRLVPLEDIAPEIIRLVSEL